MITSEVLWRYSKLYRLPFREAETAERFNLNQWVAKNDNSGSVRRYVRKDHRGFDTNKCPYCGGVIGPVQCYHCPENEEDRGARREHEREYCLEAGVPMYPQPIL